MGFRYGDGKRLYKTVNGAKTEYFYNGDILSAQKCGNDVIYFMYDNNGDIFGFTYNGAEYFYVKNAQNDVVAITDSTGNVIANYCYDDWGKITEVTGNTAIANLNPIRYRSYYYDSETQWYYLNTRYYDPGMGRFLNADSVAGVNQDINAYNIFAYCSNNPINCFDDNGQGKRWNWVKQQCNNATNWVKKQYNNCKKWMKSSSAPKNIVSSVNEEAAAQVADSCIDTVLNVSYKPYVTNISFSNTATAVVKNSVSLVNNTVYSAIAPYASSLKAINKVGGITAMVSYGINIYSDYNKYGGFTDDFYTAATITGFSTAACIGVGLICTGVGAPVGTAMVTSVVTGAVFSYYENELKKQLIGF